MQLQFENVWVLYCVWLVPALGILWYILIRRSEQAMDRFMAAPMQQKLRPRFGNRLRQVQAGLVLAGLALALVAAARPQWGIREERVFQRGRNLVIALDVSRSMLAADVRPNRLLRAKADLMDLIRELKGDRAGLLTFRRKATLLCPLTTDYAFLIQMLDTAGPDSAPAGETDIGDAIYKSLAALEGEAGAAHNAIILISDGEDLSGNAREAAKLAAEKQVPIFTVGLGNRGGSKIPGGARADAFQQYQGQDIVTKLDDSTLDELARMTGGAYVPMGTAGIAATTLGTLYRDHLRRITAQDYEESLRRRRVERYQWFLFPALLFLSAAGILSRGRLGTHRPAPVASSPPSTLPLAILLLFLGHRAMATNTVPGSGTASNTPPAAEPLPEGGGYGVAREAQALFRAGKYDEAARLYQQAARGVSETTARTFLFNAASCLYQAGKYAEAAALLRPLSLASGTPDAELLAGLGAALYRAGHETSTNTPSASRATDRELRLREAGEAFKESLRAGAAASGARHDLSLVLKQLPGAEEDALVERLTQAHASTPPDALVDQMLQAQREINRKLVAATTNASPDRIRQLETLAAAEKENAHLWIPLKGKLLQAMSSSANPADTNAQQQLAFFNQISEALRDRMMETSDSLRDLNPAAARYGAESEDGVYGLWKGVAGHDRLLTEDIRRQTNALVEPATHAVVSPAAVTDQAEARDLTRLFRRRFEESVPEQPPVVAAAGTNASPTNAISPETRRRILDLAASTESAQEKALDALRSGDLPRARREQDYSRENLLQIEKLLPRNPPPPQPQQNPQQEQKPQDSPQPEQQPAPQEQKPQEQKPEQQPQEAEQKQELPRDLEKLLEKALQREKEHEAKLREQDRNIPMSPSERDW